MVRLLPAWMRSAHAVMLLSMPVTMRPTASGQPVTLCTAPDRIISLPPVPTVSLMGAGVSATCLPARAVAPVAAGATTVLGSLISFLLLPLDISMANASVSCLPASDAGDAGDSGGTPFIFLFAPPPPPASCTGVLPPCAALPVAATFIMRRRLQARPSAAAPTPAAAAPAPAASARVAGAASTSSAARAAGATSTGVALPSGTTMQGSPSKPAAPRNPAKSTSWKTVSPGSTWRCAAAPRRAGSVTARDGKQEQNKNALQ